MSNSNGRGGGAGEVLNYYKNLNGKRLRIRLIQTMQTILSCAKF
jgi:hypothetical protein